MSWRDSLRPGSFRGASFQTTQHEATGGRRQTQFEFPQRDLPWVEDLGRKGRRYSLSVIVIGADYMTGRDALIDALESDGAGTLIHPYLGTLTVSPGEYSLSETTDEGGIARFELEFFETGAPLGPDATVDAGSAATATAAKVSDDAVTRFVGKYGVADWPAFVEEGSLSLVGRLVERADTASRLLGGAGSALRAFESGLAILPALSIIRSPLLLATSVRGLIGAVASLGYSASLRVRALRSILGDPFGWPPVIGATPSRNAERVNAIALGQLVEAVAASAAVAATADIGFTSYDEAIRHRDVLGDDLDACATRAADRGEDDHAAALDALRLAMVRDVTARGGSLARLFLYTPRTTEPALTIAYRLYGAAETIARADELVARNRIRHPGFVPGLIPLEVRTANG